MGLKLEVGKYYKTRDGRKVGPMEHCGSDTDHPWQEAKNMSAHIWRDDGTSKWDKDPDLIAPWPTETTGPVRTVTRKEIVPGKFGLVRVIEGYPDGMHVDLVRSLTLTDPAELRVAIATLTEIADALEEQ